MRVALSRRNASTWLRRRSAYRSAGRPAIVDERNKTRTTTPMGRRRRCWQPRVVRNGVPETGTGEKRGREARRKRGRIATTTTVVDVGGSPLCKLDRSNRTKPDSTEPVIAPLYMHTCTRTIVSATRNRPPLQSFRVRCGIRLRAREFIASPGTRIPLTRDVRGRLWKPPTKPYVHSRGKITASSDF